MEAANNMPNETGYWGPVDASHQFCEPHYATSIYFAEFYDSLSSIVFVLAGAWCYQSLVHTSHRPSTREQREMTWMKVASVWLAIIGVGSILYHATMRRSMQLLDEAPMLGFMATNIMYKIQKHPRTKNQARWYQTIIAVASLLLTWIYAVLEHYDIFLHGFTFMVVIEVMYGVSFYLLGIGDVTYALPALICISLGRLCWETERHLCESYPWVWMLHVVWHLLACLSAYNLLQFNCSLIGDTTKKEV